VSAKIGRPLSDNPLQNDIKVRVDNKMYHQLVEYCAKNGMSKAEAVRKAIVEMLDK
jgi:hypothetical protein